MGKGGVAMALRYWIFTTKASPRDIKVNSNQLFFSTSSTSGGLVRARAGLANKYY